MVKFSIIVPVYNTCSYLEKCLSSLVEQQNVKENYEIIVVNDGSMDSSESIILSFYEKYPNLIRYISKKHEGLAIARNEGIKSASGEYLLFVDSDDYLDLNLLEQLETHILEHSFPEIIKINSRDVTPSGITLKEVVVEKQDNQFELLKEIARKKALEVVWGYVYKTSFFKANDFQFEPQRIHEDYGLILIILNKATSISCLPYIGYNYVIRDGSIMSETGYEELKRRVDDVYYLYCMHMREIEKDTPKGKLLRSYSLEALLSKLSILHKTDLKQKLEEIKGTLDSEDIYGYSTSKKAKKVFLKVDPKIYVKLYRAYRQIK